MFVEARDETAATEQVHDMAERLLSNPVIETFVIREIGVDPGLTWEDHP